MSPQPKAPAQPEHKTPQVGERNPAVDDLLAFAQTIEDEKRAVYAKIEANRSTLRNYKTMGLLSKEQASAIDEFYPPVKSKKNAPAADAAKA